MLRGGIRQQTQLGARGHGSHGGYVVNLLSRPAASSNPVNLSVNAPPAGPIVTSLSPESHDRFAGGADPDHQRDRLPIRCFGQGRRRLIRGATAAGLVTVTANAPAEASVTERVSLVLLTNVTAEPLNEAAPNLTEAPDWKAVPLMVRVCAAGEAVMGLGERLVTMGLPAVRSH